MRCIIPVLSVLLLSACNSSDSADANDAGLIDARFLSDATRVLCSEALDQCGDLAYETLCDPARGHCVECVSEADCADTGRLGPTCEAGSGTCQCAEDADCVGRPTGNHCHPGARACGCIDTDDCAAGHACKLEPYLGTGIRTCRPM